MANKAATVVWIPHARTPAEAAAGSCQATLNAHGTLTARSSVYAPLCSWTHDALSAAAADSTSPLCVVAEHLAALVPVGHTMTMYEDGAAVPTTCATAASAVPNAALYVAPEPFDVPVAYGSVLLALRRDSDSALMPLSLKAWRALCDTTERARAAADASHVPSVLAGRVDVAGKKRKRPVPKKVKVGAKKRGRKPAARKRRRAGSDADDEDEEEDEEAEAEEEEEEEEVAEVEEEDAVEEEDEEDSEEEEDDEGNDSVEEEDEDVLEESDAVEEASADGSDVGEEDEEEDVFSEDEDAEDKSKAKDSGKGKDRGKSKGTSKEKEKDKDKDKEPRKRGRKPKVQ